MAKPKVKLKFANIVVKDKNGIIYKPEQMFSTIDDAVYRYPPTQGWEILSYPAVLDAQGKIELEVEDPT